MNRAKAEAWLNALVNLETGVGVPSGVDRRKSHPTLDRMHALLELLGSPQLEYPAIQITGTNGKTSTARMTSQLLTASGLSVGTYTSPHLERVNERIAWRGDPISDSEFAEMVSHVALVEEHITERVSYFEAITAGAFDFFAEVAVEVAVVEVGLGGTWDATNVIEAEVAVITNIGIDHTEYLGGTREEIASEKSGIIKPGSMLVLGETDPSLLSIFSSREPRSIVIRDRDFGVQSNRLAVGGRVLDLYTPNARYDDVFLALHGGHQADNAAIALCAAESYIGAPLPADVVAEVFATIVSQGRLEIVGHQPLVLLDGAHNVAGATVLLGALDEEFAVGDRTLVVGLLEGKDPAEMLTALGAKSAAHIVFTRPPSPRGSDPEALADAARELGVAGDVIDVVEQAEKALERALAVTTPDGQVVVTGSLYLVGAIRAALNPQR